MLVINFPVSPSEPIHISASIQIFFRRNSILIAMNAETSCCSTVYITINNRSRGYSRDE